MIKKRSLTPRREGFPKIHRKTVEMLAKDVRSVTPAAKPSTQWMRWWVVALAAAVLTFTVVSIRGDLWGQVRGMSFNLMVVLLMAGSALAAWASVESSLPGQEDRGNWKFRTALGLWVAAGLLLWVRPGPMVEVNCPVAHNLCVLVVLAAGSLCWAGLALILNRNAPLHPVKTGFWSGLSAYLFGSAIVTLHCDCCNLSHIVLQHLLPVLGFSAVTAWLGGKWFSGWKKKPISSSV